MIDIDDPIDIPWISLIDRIDIDRRSIDIDHQMIRCRCPMIDEPMPMTDAPMNDEPMIEFLHA